MKRGDGFGGPVLAIVDRASPNPLAQRLIWPNSGPRSARNAQLYTPVRDPGVAPVLVRRG